jgi:hypothetical protein
MGGLVLSLHPQRVVAAQFAAALVIAETGTERS